MEIELQIFSYNIKPYWFSSTTRPVEAQAIMTHATVEKAEARVKRISKLEFEGKISPACLMVIRNNLNLSRPKFAKLCEISTRTLEDYETGKRPISPVVYKLARLIGEDYE